MFRRDLPRLFLPLTVLLLQIPAAHAQPPAPVAQDARAAARDAANLGLQRFQEGRYDEALTAFIEAESHFHALTVLTMIARTYERMGRWLEARATYRRILEEQLLPYAPREFFEAQKESRQELEALEPRIPTLRIVVIGIPADAAHATIDGAGVPVDTPIALNPGHHTVAVTAPDREPSARTVTVHERRAVEEIFELPPLGAPPAEPAPATTPPAAPAAVPSAPPPPPPSLPPAPPPQESLSRPSYVPAIAAFGVATLGLGVGVVTGALTLSEVAELDQRCPDRRCYDNAAGAYESTDTLSTLSTVGFAVAGVAAAAGAALLVWPPTRRDPAQAALVLAPTAVAVRGTW